MPIVPSETSPAPLPRARLAAPLIFVLVMAASIVLHIEAWPFSDFRVFQKRTRPEDTSVLYLARASDPGHPQWIPFWENYHLQRGMTWRPEKLIREAETAPAGEREEMLEEARAMVYRGIQETDPLVWERHGALMLMQKRPRFDPATGRYALSIEHVLDLSPPGGARPTPAGGR